MKASLTIETDGPLGVSVIVDAIREAFRQARMPRGGAFTHSHRGRGEYHPGGLGAWPVVKVRWEVIT